MKPIFYDHPKKKEKEKKKSGFKGEVAFGQGVIYMEI